MRIAALVESAEHVCCRYRAAAFAEGLSQDGHALELRPLPRGAWARSRLYREVAGADVLIVQRKLLSVLELAILRRQVGHIVFDFDDAVFLRDSFHDKGSDSPSLRRRFRSTASWCHAVVAGNDWLAASARQAGAKSATVIPTCVDPSKYVLAAHDRDAHLTLVWIGSRSTLQALARAKPFLEEIGKAIPGTTLRIVCDACIDFEHLKTEHVAWSTRTEAAALVSADVGISLLPDDDWSRGKCGLKVTQYLAAGLPVVGNRVGVTPLLVRPWSADNAQWAELNAVEPPTGFLADTLKEWIDALTRLAEPALRRELGGNGRRLVEEKYSVAAGLAGWRRVLDELKSPTRQAG